MLHISLLAPSNAESGLLFGKPFDAASGGIVYNSGASLNGLQFRTNGNATRMTLTNTGNLGIGTTAPKSNIHIFRGSAGGISPNIESPLTLEANGNSFINILTPAANVSGILFGNSTNVADGGIVYGGAVRRMEFRAKANKTGMALTTDFSADHSMLGINTLNPDVELEVVHSELDGVSNHGFKIHHVSAFGDFLWNFYTTRFGDLELYIDKNSIAPRGHFIAASGEYTSLSDARNKKSVENAPDILDKVLQLKIKKYHFLENKDEDKKHYGMIAQEVEQIFPEVVFHNKVDGSNKDYYTMNYSAFGVLAIKAIQELVKTNDEKDVKIEALQKQNNDLEKRVEKLEAAMSMSLNNSSQLSKSITITPASLDQNIPNPFSNSTTIHYTLPQKFTTAQIVITDMNGKKLKQISVSGSGKGVLNADASTLSSGAYNYSLIADGKIVGTKQMLIVK